MKILITGATGFVGRKLTAKLLEQGHSIHILTRDPAKAKALFPSSEVSLFRWSDTLTTPPLEAIKGVNGVINLMGENIAAKRWSPAQKLILEQSRINSTQNLVKIIAESNEASFEFFISASAIGIYPTHATKLMTEDSIIGKGFLANLCLQWEESLNKLPPHIRKVIIRTGVVLDKSDGALKKMLPPFIMGVGGPIGNGDQMMSWIELNDLVNLYEAAAINKNFSGVYNGVTPNPVSNFHFTKALGHVLHRPTLIPVPALALKIAFGEMSSIILDSQAIISKRLPEAGFHFQYETIETALEHIFHG